MFSGLSIGDSIKPAVQSRTGMMCCAGALQVQAQLKDVPEKLRGYLYSVGSLLAGTLLGVIVYGTMYWTR